MWVLCVLLSWLDFVVSSRPSHFTRISSSALQAQLSPEATSGEGLAFSLWPLDAAITPPAGEVQQPARWPKSAAIINGSGAELTGHLVLTTAKPEGYKGL